MAKYILPILSVILLIFLYLGARRESKRKRYKSAFILYILLTVISIVLLLRNLL